MLAIAKAFHENLPKNGKNVLILFMVVFDYLYFMGSIPANSNMHNSKQMNSTLPMYLES